MRNSFVGLTLLSFNSSHHISLLNSFIHGCGVYGKNNDVCVYCCFHLRIISL